MRYKSAVHILWAAGLVVTGGCAGVGGDGAAPAASVAPASEAAAFRGTWHGVFEQVGVGDTGQVQGDIECEIREDGSYRATWTTERVAGSSRGTRAETSGRVIANGQGLTFSEAGGSSFTLKRRGGTLYGIRKDPVSGRTIAVELGRAPESS